MTAADLLLDLEKRDIRLALSGDRLKVDAPRGALTDELRQDLEVWKPELITLIQERDSMAVRSAEEIAAMSLDELAQAGLIIRVHSEVLSSQVLFVSDNVPDHALADLDLPVYRTAELRKLAILRPEPRSLRYIHDVKTLFNGAIIHVRAQENNDEAR